MLPQHETYLRDRAVPPEVWEERGTESVPEDGAQRLLDAGFAPSQLLMPGVLFPKFNPLGKNGQYQYRPDKPGKAKFLSPKGQRGVSLDVHPRNVPHMTDASVDLWITEGIPKADAATARGLCIVAVLGVSAWKSPDWKYIELAGRKVYLAFDSDVMTKREVHSQLRLLSDHLQTMGAHVAYAYLPADGEKVGLDDYFALGHSVEELYDLVEPNLRPLAGGQPFYSLDDVGNGRRFAWQHKDAARYSKKLGWYVWTGTRWQGEEDRERTRVMRLAKQTRETILDEAREAVDDGRRTAIGKHHGATGSGGRLEQMIKMASSEEALEIEQDAFNRDPELFNVANGTLNLRTRVLQPYNPDDLITHWCPTPYVADAIHPMLERYLDELYLSPAMRAFLPRALGCSLIGHNHEEVFFFVSGAPGAGKGTLMEMVSATVNGYADSIGQKFYAGGEANERLKAWARVKEARILFTDEWPERTPIDAATVKQLTGGSPIEARHMYRDLFLYTPLFTPWLFGNFRPDAPADDAALFRRMIVLLFPAERDVKMLDKTLKETLKTDPEAREAILRWMVDGACDYLTNGLQVPPEARQETQEYRDALNPLTDWRRAWCVEGPEHKEQSSTLLSSYHAWERAQGNHVPMTAPKFAGFMRAAGFQSAKSTGGAIFWFGLALNGEENGENGPESGGGGGLEPVLQKSRRDSIGVLEKGPKPSTSSTFGADSSPPRIIVGDTPLPVEYITDAGKANAALGKLVADRLILDIETTGLSPRKDRVRLVQIEGNDAIYIFDLAKVPLDRARLLEGREVVGHNLAFEFGFLPPLKSTRAWDTMLASQVLTMGVFGGNALDDVAMRHAGVEMDKTHQKSDWTGDLTDDQLRYAADDVRYLQRIMDDQLCCLRNHFLLPTAELEMRALMGIQWMAGQGAPLDWAAWEALAHRTMEEQAVLGEELQQWAAINWNSGQQVQRFFGTSDAKDETISSCGHAAVPTYRSWKSLSKLSSTYGLNWRDYFSAGRIHADWRQIEARTGRMSCTSPNLQNIPRYSPEHPHRSLFRAPAGRVLIKADYSQIELRIAAQLSGDATMLSAYRNGDDIHTITAAAITHKPIGAVTKDDRQLAKAVNFGLLYGMGAPGLQRSAKSGYDIELDGAEAYNHRQAWLKQYPGIAEWQKQQGGGWDDAPCDTYTLLGRRRQGVPSRTHKLNSPVQGTGADGIKHALALMWERQMPDVFPVMVVHDEIVVEAPESDAEAARDWTIQAMVDGMAAYVTEVPVDVEATIARGWAG
jgi:DNA polymerase-1